MNSAVICSDVIASARESAKLCATCVGTGLSTGCHTAALNGKLIPVGVIQLTSAVLRDTSWQLQLLNIAVSVQEVRPMLRAVCG